MKVFVVRFVFLFSLIFASFFFLVTRVWAYEIIAVPESPKQLTTSEADEYLYGNIDKDEYEKSVVTENTKTVKVKFSGLKDNTEYVACLSANCLYLEKKEDMSTFDLLKKLGNDLKFEKVKSDDNGNGDLSITVCADGKNNLKKIGDNDNCSDDDYFWGGSVYAVVLLSQESILDPIDAAFFYVSRYYPEVKISPEKPTPDDPIVVTISGTRRPHDRENRNNYLIGIAKAGNSRLSWKDCEAIVGNSSVAKTIPSREQGDYTILIAELANEGSFKCVPSFIYYSIRIHVRKDTDKNKGIEIIPDPGGADIPGGKIGADIPPPPCATNMRNNLEDTCPRVKTAIGDIETSPVGFVKSVFSLVLGLAGGLAILLIIYSGFQLIESRGNPEKLESAREQLTSAIIGLLFIIFSLVVIQFLGVDILKLPGLGR